MGDWFGDPNLERVGLFLGGVFALWIVTGWLKGMGVGREGDIRKVNHIVGFTGGAFLFGWLPEPQARASLYLGSAGLLVLVAITCRWRNRVPFRYGFAANTRVSDHPREAFYFWSSWFSSIFALLLIDLVFGSFAVVRTAALIVGIADGIAEPIGRRIGYHRYRGSNRTVEGSVSVLLGTLLVLGLFTVPGDLMWVNSCMLISTMAMIVTFVEVLSPRGSDNFTIAIVSGAMLKGVSEMGWLGFR